MEIHQYLVAIPAFNEAALIKKTIYELLDAGIGRILVVDDGSYDETSSIVGSLPVYYIRHDTNLGYEASLLTAFHFAMKTNFAKIVYFDADGEHPANKVKEFVELLDHNLCVIGDRDRKNRLLELLLSYYCQYKYKITDPYCGMKGYNLKEIQNYNYIKTPAHDTGIGLLLEIARQTPDKIESVPIQVGKRVGVSRFSRQIFHANFFLFKNFLGAMT